MVLFSKAIEKSESIIHNYVNKNQNTFLKRCFKQKQLILLALPAFLTYRNLYVSGGTEEVDTTGIEALHQKLTW